ncbi:hypothetical protein COO60DRAFT_1484088 [Scenedesmus sp. NREL 46B-D3]|nr:hypothetical protein COO60DRAFT_1484088 [Scenedesmus sp. NREL 46B-D3]
MARQLLVERAFGSAGSCCTAVTCRAAAAAAAAAAACRPRSVCCGVAVRQHLQLSKVCCIAICPVLDLDVVDLAPCRLLCVDGAHVGTRLCCLSKGLVGSLLWCFGGAFAGLSCLLLGNSRSKALGRVNNRCCPGGTMDSWLVCAMHVVSAGCDTR